MAKFVSRLGQGFSTSHETIIIDNYWVDDDIEHDGYVFSDGIGTISTFLATEVNFSNCFKFYFLKKKIKGK